jgi:hypothetical protein
MGLRTAGALFVGMVLNFVIIAPWMISIGEITPKAGSIAEGTAVFGRAHILNSWSLWWGITMMVVMMDRCQIDPGDWLKVGEGFTGFCNGDASGLAASARAAHKGYVYVFVFVCVYTLL